MITCRPLRKFTLVHSFYDPEPFRTQSGKLRGNLPRNPGAEGGGRGYDPAPSMPWLCPKLVVTALKMDQDNLNRLRERTEEYSSTRDRLTLFFVLVLTPYASNRRVEGGRSRRQRRRGFCLSRSRCVVGVGPGSDRQCWWLYIYRLSLDVETGFRRLSTSTFLGDSISIPVIVNMRAAILFGLAISTVGATITGQRQCSRVSWGCYVPGEYGY